MGRYLLDSNAFLGAKDKPQTLRREAREIIQETQNALFVSVVSLWELADKASKGKLPEFATILEQMPGTLEAALSESSFQLLPIKLAHIASTYMLPLHHRDPFDRMMIAQALVEDLTIITSDNAFQRYTGLRILSA